MKKILFTSLFLAAFLAGYTQMGNNGGTITVENGATLVIEGNYTSINGGVFDIKGNVQLKGNFINNGGSITNGSSGLLTFNGISGQEITGSQSTTFHCAVAVNNAAGVALTNTQTGADQVADSVLTLTSGKITLNNFNLTANQALTATSANYVVTNGTGELKRPVAATDVTFPVGTSTSYNPLILNNAGTADTYGVGYTNALPGLWTGTTHAVNSAWTVTEAVPGGSNLTATPQWNGAQEQPALPAPIAMWALQPIMALPRPMPRAARQAVRIRTPGAARDLRRSGNFLVADYFFRGIVLNVGLFLAGPYNGSTMNNSLYTAGIIPTTDPYGLGTNVSTIPSSAVDWIEVQLRDKNNHATTLYSRAFFLDQSGNILNINGTTGALLTSIPKDQYYVAVLHRNHFGIISSSTIDLSTASPTYNFKTAQSQAWQNSSITTNAAMKEISTGVYGLWSGDANNDGTVNYFGAGTDRASLVSQLGATTLGIPIAGYFNNDMNMDGTVNYFGAGTDRSVLVAILGATTLGIPITRHLP